MAAGCEEIFDSVGVITYSVHVGWRRSSKCWRIIVPENKYLNLRITDLRFVTTVSATCKDANISISWEASSTKPITFCPGDESSELKSMRTFSDTEIKHRRSSKQSFENIFDSFTISYSIEDLLCLKPDSFKCSPTSCVLSEMRCDGMQNCFDGADERGCERGVFTVMGVNSSRILGVNWLKKQRNAAWGWRENTHRAITALYLGQGVNFNGTDLGEDLMAKQLELQMSTAILRNETDLITPSQLAMYINALLVICHDPRNFYGFNLVRDLQKRVENSINTTHPLPYLTLCNAKEDISDEGIDKLISILESSSNHSFLTDVQAMALMTLSCVGNTPKISEFKENITYATDRLKRHQSNDGSFGNIYTTALVVQALLSSGNEEDKEWNLKAAIEFLMKKQNKNDGSFGDFLATYMVLPILNAKSLADIRKVNCTENLKMPRDNNPVSDIESKLGPKMSIKYFLYVGDQKDQVHPLFLRTPCNITVLEVMRLASEVDTKFRFQAQRIGKKLYIYELFGIANDPEDEKFWLLYKESRNSTLKLITLSPDEAYLNNNDKIIMWYKSAQID
ncbi:uncharacterized protein CG3556 [Nephila pilipes]|uniref:Uncharacterized protein CG3556 n=1 Tax=Nephila pilipes TaxID=299642 RepID=A0A8X6I2Y4_NEPPI|nr:uncharacterized protein CG3556 [Nephila pilipes]